MSPEKKDDFEEAFDTAAVEDAGGTAGTEGLDIDGELGTAGDQVPAGELGTAGDSGTAGTADIDYEQKYKSLQGIHKSDNKKWTDREKELLEQIDQYGSAGTAGTALSEETQKKETLSNFKDTLTDEQKVALDEYETDFAEVSKMEGMKRELAMEGLKKELKAFRDEVTAQLTPATSLLKNLEKKELERSEEDHFSAIVASHSDYETYVDNGGLREWIDTKPKYLRKGMLETYESGTAEDIIDLLTDFKLENNITVAGTPNKKLDAKREAITAVATKRGAVGVAKALADDFESAFDEALNL